MSYVWKMCLWPQNKFRSQWPIFHRPVIFLLLFFALKNILVLLAKLNSGELCCPATALIYLISILCESTVTVKNLLSEQKLYEPPHDKTNKMAWVPTKNSDKSGHPHSLIRVFAVCMKKTLVLSYILSAQQRLCSDWVDAKIDLSLSWVHMPFLWFCHDAAPIIMILRFGQTGLCKQCRPRWRGNLIRVYTVVVFAILFVAFWCITVWQNHTVLIVGLLQQFFLGAHFDFTVFLHEKLSQKS